MGSPTGLAMLGELFAGIGFDMLFIYIMVSSIEIHNFCEIPSLKTIQIPLAVPSSTVQIDNVRVEAVHSFYSTYNN